MVKAENERLTSRSDVLERQVVKYAELHTEEKNERKAILNKFEHLQNQYNQKIESFTKEKVYWTKRYYLLLGMAVLLVLLLVWLALPVITQNW